LRRRRRRRGSNDFDRYGDMRWIDEFVCVVYSITAHDRTPRVVIHCEICCYGWVRMSVMMVMTMVMIMRRKRRIVVMMMSNEMMCDEMSMKLCTILFIEIKSMDRHM